MAVMTDLLREPSLPEEKRLEFLNSIRTTIDRMEWLVSTLLKLAKLDAGSVVMKAEPFGVLALCREAVNPLLIRAELGGVSLSVSGCNAVLSCDRRWTEEAVLNIVKNCIEHTAPSGWVRVQCIDNPLHVRVEVTDNGGGIHPEDLPHIFEKMQSRTAPELGWQWRAPSSCIKTAILRRKIQTWEPSLSFAFLSRSFKRKRDRDSVGLR